MKEDNIKQIAKERATNYMRLKKGYKDKTMKTLLWLDDIRDPFDKDFTPYVALYNPFLNEPHKVEWVKNYAKFTEYIVLYGIPDAISFDHDLADEHYQMDTNPEDYKEETGMDCVKFLCNIIDYNNTNYSTNYKLPICIFHTANPAGKANMQTYIENAKKHLNL